MAHFDSDDDEPRGTTVSTAAKATAGPEDLESYFKIERNEERGVVTMCKVREGRSSFWGFGSGTTLVKYRLISPSDPDRAAIAALQAESFRSNPRLGKAVASFCAMALGDSLGCPMEFRPVCYDDDHPVITDLDYTTCGSFGLRPGQWTDDASMGACIADSLIASQGFDPYDMKVRFVNWWNYGYNNAFRNEKYAKGSVGLGGNISMSFGEFYKSGTVYTRVGDANTCGNGSLMRNGALAVYYHDNLDGALDIARKQSYLTHQGTEAAECCALLTYVAFKGINDPAATKETILGDVINTFADLTTCASVKCLARSEQEPGGNPDRNWQWRAAQYYYSPTRARQQPGYVGSYAMDALAMALHCVWTTSDFRSAVLKAANRCGDADSVADITGQIAGAIYGYDAIPPSWMVLLNKWDDNDFAVKAYKMFMKHPRGVVETQLAPRASTRSRYDESDDEDDAGGAAASATGGAAGSAAGSAASGGVSSGAPKEYSDVAV